MLTVLSSPTLASANVPVADTVAGWEDYDLVYLGFPIWYYGAPNVVNTFAKGYDWQGKRVVLFATSGGSDIGRTAEKLQPCMPAGQILKARVLKGPEGLDELLS